MHSRRNRHPLPTGELHKLIVYSICMIVLPHGACTVSGDRPRLALQVHTANPCLPGYWGNVEMLWESQEV